MISVPFQGKAFNITVIQVYAPTSNAEEAEVEQLYEDLQDLLELTPKKDVRFIIGDRNETVGSQETRGVTGKFGLGVQKEAGQMLIEFCQKNALVTANTLLQQVLSPHNKLEISERNGNTRTHDLPLEKSVCRSGSNS